MIRRQHAEAIRFGITQARKARYGDVDDPYYELRSDVIWSYFMQSALRELAHTAFTRTWRNQVARARSAMTDVERRESDRAFETAYERWRESPEERQSRLLREEVADLRRRVAELEV